ncbi:MAG: ATP-binding protein [Ignavibacteriaceae bacterium]|nr:ATP-binding protein [Ignavibacteriaceae bacterium]
MPKKLPSKSSNYADLVQSGAFYADKTAFIRKLEDLSDKFIVFLRPRRFGKSLFLSVLEHYYGIQHKERFGELFGEYYIGQPENTTELRNSYHILRFDFSGISTGNPENTKKSFIHKLRKGFLELHANYGIFDKEIIENPENEPADYFLIVLSEIHSQAPDLKIYLLIDEYDHFTNEVFAFSNDQFLDIVSKNGWVRKFYEVVKQFTANSVIKRFFATGVTPVTLDSLTSGFNIALNISLYREFNSLAGFTESELKNLISETLPDDVSIISEGIYEELRFWYNGSRFSGDADQKLYNPQMIIGYLNNYYLSGQKPDQMTDPNVVSDYRKIASVLEFLPFEQSDELISEVTRTDSITERLTVQFNFELPYGKTEAVSLLYYNGLLSIDSVRFGVYRFVIPNYLIKTIYWEYFRYLFEKRNNLRFDTGKTDQAIFQLSSESSIDKLTGYVAEVMRGLSNRDLQNFSEKSLKMIFMTILTGTNAYYVQSEAETKSGYADLIIRRTGINPGRHDFLIELKYVKKGDQKNLEAIKESGLNQLSGYFSSMPEHERANYRAFLVIFTDKSGFEITQL